MTTGELFAKEMESDRVVGLASVGKDLVSRSGKSIEDIVLNSCRVLNDKRGDKPGVFYSNTLTMADGTSEVVFLVPVGDNFFIGTRKDAMLAGYEWVTLQYDAGR